MSSGRPEEDVAGATAPPASRPPRSAERARSIEAAAAAGICYSVLTVLALNRMSTYPDLDASGAELTAWFDDDTNRFMLAGALSLASVSAIAFLWFIAVVRRRLGEHEDKFFATVFLGSGITYVAIWLVGSAALAGPAIAMTTLDAAEVSPASASLAGGVAAALLLVVAPRVEAVFIFSTSTVFLRSSVLPSWVAYVGYVAGLVMFLAPLIWVPLGYAFPTWVFIVSVVLLVVRPSSLESEVGDPAIPSTA